MAIITFNPTVVGYINKETDITFNNANPIAGGQVNTKFEPFLEYNTSTLPKDIQITKVAIKINVLRINGKVRLTPSPEDYQNIIDSVGAKELNCANDRKALKNGYITYYFSGVQSDTTSYSELQFDKNAVLEITYIDIPPQTPALPISASDLNKYLTNRLAWTNTSTQVSSTVAWSTDNFTTIQTIAGGANSYIDVPSGTFPIGAIKWKVKILGANGLESEYSLPATFTSFEIPLPQPINLNPTGKQDKYKPIDFNWDGQSVIGARYEIQYNVNNTGWQVLARNLSVNNYTAAKNVFVLGELNWKVRTTSQAGQVSDWSNTATITIAEVPPQKPFNLNPSGNIDKFKDILFTWNIEEGITQTKFEFEYSQDNAQSWTKKIENSTATKTTIPANTFVIGNLLWRVRVTDSDGLVSEYSNQESCKVILFPPNKPINLNPNSGSIKRDLGNKFTWDLDGAQQSKFTFTYSQDNAASWTDIKTSTSNNYIIIVPNTFAKGTLLWKVKIADVNGVESEYSNQASLDVVETVIVLPTPPINLEPTDTNVNLEVVDRFSWYASEVQKDFTFAYSQDGGLNWKTITSTTSNKYVDVPANTFTEGSLLWKVRYTSVRNVTSEYSAQASVNIIDKPIIPTVMLIEAKSLETTIRWVSEDQFSFQLQILKGSVIILDTLEVSSTNKFYTTPLILENNVNYTFKLRVKNVYGLWSDLTSKGFLNKFTAPSAPAFDIFNLADRLQLNINNPIAGEKVLYNNVYRSEDNLNFVKIATNIKNNYIDFKIESEKKYYYKVEAISEFGYAYSTVLADSILLNHTQLSYADSYFPVKIKYNIKRNISKNKNVAFLQFSGRKKVVSEHGEEDAEININMNFKLIDKQELNNLEIIYNNNKTLIYRDNRGRKVFCEIITYNCDDAKSKNYDITLQLKEVAYKEEV